MPLLPFNYFKNSYDSNKDGMGLLANIEGKLMWHKELNSLTSFYQVYCELRENHPSATIAIHFRLATHGLTDLDNCHPFEVHDDLGFIHNGIIHGFGNTMFSDTVCYNEEILKKLPKDFYMNEAIMTLVEKSIPGSKFVFLDSKGNHAIANSALGHWFEGNWFSNSCYKDYEYSMYPYQSSRYWTDYYDEGQKQGRWAKAKEEYKKKHHKKEEKAPKYLWNTETNEWALNKDHDEVCTSCGIELLYDFEHKEKLCTTCISTFRTKADYSPLY